MEKFKKFMKVYMLVLKWGVWGCGLFSTILLLISCFTDRISPRRQIELVGICLICLVMWTVVSVIEGYEEKIRLYKEISARDEEIQERQDELIQKQRELIQKQRENLVRADTIIDQKQRMIEELEKKSNESGRLHDRKRSGRKAGSHSQCEFQGG